MDVGDYMQANLAKMFEIVDTAEVLTVGFSLFPERLLTDFRSSDLEPPLIEVVQPVGSAEERIREIRRRRPTLGTPERFFFFMWPRSVQAFVDFGLWGRIADRVEATNHPGLGNSVNEALAVLRQLERDEKLQAIRGPRYRTLWQRKEG